MLNRAAKLMKGICISLLKCCKSMSQLKQIQTAICTVGLQQDRDTLNKLMEFCIHSSVGDFHYAHRIFNRIHEPSLFVYNIMIKAFVIRGSFREAVSLFGRMRYDAMSPDNYTYPYVLKAIGCIGEVHEGEKVHALVVKTGLESDPYVCNSLMDMYAEFGKVGRLKQLFDEMLERDKVSWNIMIAGYARCGKFQEAIDVFQQMQKESNEKPNEATVVSTLAACTALKNIKVDMETHSYIKKELDLTAKIGNALLDMYCKCGCLSEAQKIFYEMPAKNVNCWTTMVAGYVNCGQLDEARALFDEAIALFQEMQNTGINPDKFILVSLLTGCAQLGALEQGKWIHNYIDESRIKVNAVVGTALIEMYAKCGYIEKSLEVFYGLRQKDTTTWTSIIYGLAMNGRAGKALELFEAMGTFGARPDGITFTAVLSACCHGGLVEEGRKYFHSMKRIYLVEPSIVHYGCFIDLLGRAGLLDEAEELIKKFPDQNNEMIIPLYGALLSSCRLHGNIDMGERIAVTYHFLGIIFI